MSLEKALQDIRDGKVTQVDLSFKGIGDDEAQKIADAIKASKAVTSIVLRNNNISAKGAKHIADAVKENKSVTDVDISYNSLGDEGVKHIAEAIKENKSITKIYVSSNNSGDKGTEHIVDALKVNTTITTVSVSYIDDATTKEILSLLERNSTIAKRRRALAALLSCLSSTRSSTPFNDSCFERNELFEIHLLGLVVEFVA